MESLAKNEQAGRQISLAEEYAVILADEASGALLKRLNQFGIGEECGRVELHLRSPEDMTRDAQVWIARAAR